MYSRRLSSVLVSTLVTAVVACRDDEAVLDDPGDSDDATTSTQGDLPGSTSHVSSSSGEDSAPSDSSSSLDDSTGDPPSCGNGVLDPGEDCDPTAPESDACCTAECTIARPGCGNGCAERGEWCWDDAMLDEHPLLTGDLVAISVGDVNADGDADLIVLEKFGVWVGFGDGGGVSFEWPMWPTDFAYEPLSLGVADLNGDDRSDVVVLVPEPDPSVSAFHLAARAGGGDGLGDLFWLENFGAGFETRLALGDVTGDGLVDAVGAFPVVGQLVVAPGDGTGAFAQPISYDMGDFGTIDPNTAAIGDVDGDGMLDVVVARGPASNPVPRSLWVYRQLEDGTLARGDLPDIELDSAARSLVVVDLDGDGRAEIVVSLPDDDELRVTGFDAEGQPWIGEPIAAGAEHGVVEFPIAADLDYDGTPDLVVRHRGGTTVTLLRNLGQMDFAPPLTIDMGAPVIDVCVGDLDGDGVPDIAAATESPTSKVTIALSPN